MSNQKSKRSRGVKIRAVNAWMSHLGSGHAMVYLKGPCLSADGSGILHDCSIPVRIVPISPKHKAPAKVKKR